MKKPAILCVDDEIVILTSLRDQLLYYIGGDYTVEIAESGEEALEVMEELLKEGVEVPLIISDQIMPGIKGDELLSTIHDRYPQSLKIFLTGQADANAVGNAVNRANLYRYISKPWDEADLKLTVTEALYRYSRDKQLAEQHKLLEKLYAQAQQEINERKRMEALLAEANQNLEQKVSERTQELSEAIQHLKDTQNQLIVQEKMASLGMLSSGIAHEIKNPLNLINSFAILSVELTSELKGHFESQNEQLDAQHWNNIRENLQHLQSNIEIIVRECGRIESIIRSMLLHSRDSKEHRLSTNINALLEETVNFIYHSMRSKENFFDVQIDTHYDSTIEHLTILPQGLSRVFVNLVNNAYYAFRKKKELLGESYIPCLTVRTQNAADSIEIRIKDNGIGIPEDVRPKIFYPFFTTKPPGDGAGLGLYISYDIIVHGHQGKIDVESVDGQYTEFIISLPKSL